VDCWTDWVVNLFYQYTFKLLQNQISISISVAFVGCKCSSCVWEDMALMQTLHLKREYYVYSFKCDLHPRRCGLQHFSWTRTSFESRWTRPLLRRSPSVRDAMLMFEMSKSDPRFSFESCVWKRDCRVGSFKRELHLRRRDSQRVSCLKTRSWRYPHVKLRVSSKIRVANLDHSMIYKKSLVFHKSNHLTLFNIQVRICVKLLAFSKVSSFCRQVSIFTKD